MQNNYCMKNLLFIAPIFFDYYKDIKAQFEKEGYIVYYFNDRPSERFVSKAALRLNRNSQKRAIDRYITKILNSVENIKLDLVFVILGQSFSRGNIVRIKEKHPEARYIYYSWDSVKNFPNILEFRDCFDKVFHFDSRDASEYGFDFLPLYYSNRIKKIEPTYSFSAVFTVKRGKLKKYLKIMELIPDEIKKDGFIYLYIQSRFVFLFYKLKYKEFRKSHVKDFKFKKLSRDDFYEIMSKSRVIIDVQMKSQTGLTMRTLEAIHAQKKLITTNPSVVNYDFYTPNNICVINKNHCVIPEDFFSTPFDKKGKIAKDYSLANFVRTLIDSNY